MSELSGVMTAAAELEAFCRQQQWRFCFIGGVAVQRWGMPRFTQDVDISLLTGIGGEAQFIDHLLRRFSPRLKSARQFALDHRVLLARTAGGINLDIALGAFPFEEESIQRATSWKVSDTISLTTCSAEDLIIHKVFAARDRDWADVETILARQHGNLDLQHIRSHLPPLLELKEDIEALPRLERLITAVQKRIRP